MQIEVVVNAVCGKVLHEGERYQGAHGAIIDREIWNAVQSQLKSNAADRCNGTNARFPSLLTGLLRDEHGNRLTPNHACKASKRYRYCVSEPDTNGFAQTGLRLPAQEVERVVIDGLANFLSGPVRLTDNLPIINAPPSALNTFFTGAAELARQIKEGSLSETKFLLHEFRRRINVGSKQIGIVLSADRLLGMVKGIDVKSRDATHSQPELITFSLPFSFRRRARGEKLLIAGGDTLSPKPDTQLIKAIALGHRWFSELTKGSNASLSELTERHGVDRADASRIIRLALLAPDIVDAILKGRQPRDLSLRRLKRLTDLPLIWEEQRRVLGFTS